ncbi:MAG: hypothetical protein ACP5IC_01990 [Minisyncoccia bacterium]
MVESLKRKEVSKMGLFKLLAEALADLAAKGYDIDLQSGYHKHNDGTYGHDHYQVNPDGTYTKTGHDNDPPLRSGYETQDDTQK